MRSTFSSLLVATALLAGSTTVAVADPVRPPTSERVESVRVSDATQYAAREAKDTAVQKFQGGSEVVVISGSVVGILLLVILLVIVL